MKLWVSRAALALCLAGVVSIAGGAVWGSRTAAQRGGAPGVPDPASDYATIDDVKMDGARAVGRTLLLRGWRGSPNESEFSLHPCDSPRIQWVKVRYTRDQVDRVRALPSSALGSCPRVLLRIVGRGRINQLPIAELVQVLDVTAIPQRKSEVEGIDFVHIDDVLLAGRAAQGRTARLGIWRGEVDEAKFVAYPCGDDIGVGAFLRVFYAEDQREAVRDLSTSMRACTEITVQLSTANAVGTWQARLVEVNGSWGAPRPQRAR